MSSSLLLWDKKIDEYLDAHEAKGVNHKRAILYGVITEIKRGWEGEICPFRYGINPESSLFYSIVPSERYDRSPSNNDSILGNDLINLIQLRINNMIVDDLEQERYIENLKKHLSNC